MFRFSSGIAVTCSELPFIPPVVCPALAVVGALCSFPVPVLICAMKFFGTILLASASFLNGRVADEAKAAEATNGVVISTDYINRLVAEARTNHPSLKAADARVRSAARNAEAVRTWDDPMASFGGSVFSSKGMSPAE